MAKKKENPLARYLRERKLTYAAFGRDTDLTGRMVQKIAEGEALPRPAPMSRIQKVTGGKVTIQGLYDTYQGGA